MSLTEDGALVPAVDQPFTHILKPPAQRASTCYRSSNGYASSSDAPQGSRRQTPR